MNVPGDNPPASKPEAAETAPEGAKEQKPPRVIKRYSNRKLYDTQSSKYVTLEEIAHMIKAGEELSIIDNKTKDDLTAVTLTQIIYEEEKRKSRMPLGMLRELITSSGDALKDVFERSVKNPVAEMRASADRGVTEIRQSAIQFREAATRSVSELTERARTVFTRNDAEERKTEEALKGIEESFEEVKKKVVAQAQRVESDSAKIAEHVAERLEARVAGLQLLIGQIKTAAQARQAAQPENREEPDPGN